MLNTKFIYFSRTLTNDYRWIYSSEYLKMQDKEIIMNDYSTFEASKEQYLTNPHMLVRRLESGVILYRFFKTERIDQNARTVYALSGHLFTDFDYKIFCRLHDYIMSYFFVKVELFEPDEIEINDSISNAIYLTDFSIDKMMDEVKQDFSIDSYKEMLYQYSVQASTDSFLLTTNGITPILKQSNYTNKAIRSIKQTPITTESSVTESITNSEESSAKHTEVIEKNECQSEASIKVSQTMNLLDKEGTVSPRNNDNNTHCDKKKMSTEYMQKKTLD